MPRGARPGERRGGRAKGVPNKITATLKDAILSALDEVGGKAYLVAVAREDSRTFCALLGRVLPSEVKAELSGSLTLGKILADLKGPQREQ